MRFSQMSKTRKIVFISACVLFLILLFCLVFVVRTPRDPGTVMAMGEEGEWELYAIVRSDQEKRMIAGLSAGMAAALVAGAVCMHVPSHGTP